MRRNRRLLLVGLYLLTTVQFVWCYLWLVRPYVFTRLYELGLERMPFQGRVLMMYPMQWAHDSTLLKAIGGEWSKDRYWFPRPVQPEVIAQAIISIACIAVAGWVATRIYTAASRVRLLTPIVYPLVLLLCGVTYVLHTIQNFRFLYDLPSLAFFSIAFGLIYFRRHPLWFSALFVVATINRETALLMLAFWLLDSSVRQERFAWRNMLSARNAAWGLPLACFWVGWQIHIHRMFAANASEFYARVPFNISLLLSWSAWPQLLTGICIFVLVGTMRQHIQDRRLRAWLWAVPVWFAFMFVYGILIETRIFGELIPYMACISALIAEDVILARVRTRMGLLELSVEPGRQPLRVRDAA